MRVYGFLADMVVVAHATYIAFVIAGLLAILVGIIARWRWVRNFWFRTIHLIMIGIVVFQAVFGITCPLTTLEHYLRLQAGQPVYAGTFIGHWMHELIFYEGPSWVFTLSYCLFGAVVLGTLFLAPPRWPRKRPKADQQAR